MDKKFWISGIAASVVAFAAGFVVHGVLLHNDYAQLPSLMRTENDAMSHLPYLIVAHIVFGFAFAWVYSQGISAGVPWLTQGVRFGIAVALLVTIPMYLIYYAVQPWPGMTVAKQIVFDTISVIIIGILVAFINKPASATESA
jgi:hypothetical protein